MARINVEQKALTDPRFAVLGALLKAPRKWQHAAGLWAAVQVWNECQERGSYQLPAPILEAIHEGLASAIVTAELADATADGAVRIKGTEGRVEWLAKRREDGAKGGRPPNPRVIETETMGIDGNTTPGRISDNPLAPTLGSGSGSVMVSEAQFVGDASGSTHKPGLKPGSALSFDRFWAKYPPRNGRKDGKAKALAQWKAKGCADVADQILAALAEQIQHREEAMASGLFVAEFPDAFRWLQGKRWQDEITEPERGPLDGLSEKGRRTAMSLRRWMERDADDGPGQAEILRDPHGPVRDVPG